MGRWLVRKWGSIITSNVMDCSRRKGKGKGKGKVKTKAKGGHGWGETRLRVRVSFFWQGAFRVGFIVVFKVRLESGVLSFFERGRHSLLLLELRPNPFTSPNPKPNPHLSQAHALLMQNDLLLRFTTI